MIVKDIMHHIIKVPLDTTVSEAAKLMDRKVIGSLVIEEGGRMVGIVTERDILRKVVAAERNLDKTTVKDIMSCPLITIASSASLEAANDLMANHKIRRLMVTEDGEIVGIITTRNVMENIRYTLGRIIKDDSSYSRPSYGRSE